MKESIGQEPKIPAEAWFEAIAPLLRDGYQFKICPQGRSMVPFLCGGRDEAVLSVPDEGHKYRKNEVVLFKLDCGIHVLHRICRVNKKGIFTLGDGNVGIEGPFQQDDILAVVDYIIRKGKIIRNGSRGYLLLVSVWRIIRPFRPSVMRGYSAFRRLEHRVKNR